MSKEAVGYCVRRDGRLGVNVTFHGKKGYPGLPVFGLGFELPKEADRFSWYGRGPWENYPDRKAAGMWDAHGYPVAYTADSPGRMDPL